MGTYEDRREDAKRDAYYDRLDRAMPDTCECGVRDWQHIGFDPAYGADADGRRGMRIDEWECIKCGALATT